MAGRDLEVSVAASGDRVQMRPVRFAPGASRANTSRDRDIETAWCGDFVLKGLNADFAVERALPVGSPVMVVVEDVVPEDRRDEPPAVPRTHTIKPAS